MIKHCRAAGCTQRVSHHASFPLCIGFACFIRPPVATLNVAMQRAWSVETVILSKSFVRFLPLALSLPALPIYAADSASTDADQMPVMVITASRTPQPLKDVIGDVTVIDRQTLDRYQGESVLNALQVQAGVQIATNGGAGKTSSVFLRGANASQTLVLIDGVRYGSATSGGAALEHIPADQIERVEILRGPAASLYGADAIGGVIQIFTRQGHKTPEAHISVGAGNYGMQQANAGISGQIGETRGSINLSHSKTDGTSAIVDRKSSMFYGDDDGYENNSISASVQQQITPTYQVGANLLYADVENHYDASGYDADYNAVAQSYDYRSKGHNAVFSLWNQIEISNTLSSHVQLSRSIDDSDSFTPVAADNYADVTSTFKTTQDQLTIHNNLIVPTGTVSVGAEALRQRIDSTEDFATTQRKVYSALAGYLGNYGSSHLQTNLRYDDNSQYGDQTTYSLAASQDLSQALTIGAVHGTGFRAPSFNELYYPFYGIATLKPEESRSNELYAAFKNTVFTSRLTVYRNEVKNLIQYDSSIFGPANIGKARLQGLTLTSDWQQDALQAGFSYDYLDATDDSGTATDGKQLARRAKNSGLIYAGFHQKDLTSRLEVQAVGKRFDNASNSKRLAGYALVNIASTVTLSPEWQIGVRLNNLLDKDYEQVKGYGTLGFNGLLTLTYTPKL
jgi:vitamin B12 transporter